MEDRKILIHKSQTVWILYRSFSIPKYSVGHCARRFRDNRMCLCCPLRREWGEWLRLGDLSHGGITRYCESDWFVHLVPARVGVGFDILVSQAAADAADRSIK